jgi:hypothetical protein
MTASTVPRIWPKERRAVCHSAPGVPHGEWHNAVCVCHCRWCVAERGERTDTDAQLTLAIGIANV